MVAPTALRATQHVAFGVALPSHHSADATYGGKTGADEAGLVPGVLDSSHVCSKRKGENLGRELWASNTI